MFTYYIVFNYKVLKETETKSILKIQHLRNTLQKNHKNCIVEIQAIKNN